MEEPSNRPWSSWTDERSCENAKNRKIDQTFVKEGVDVSIYKADVWMSSTQVWFGLIRKDLKMSSPPTNLVNRADSVCRPAANDGRVSAELNHRSGRGGSSSRMMRRTSSKAGSARSLNGCFSNGLDPVSNL